MKGFVVKSPRLPPSIGRASAGIGLSYSRGRGGGAADRSRASVVPAACRRAGPQRQARPDHLLSVVAQGDTPAAICARPPGAPLHLKDGSRRNPGFSRAAPTNRRHLTRRRLRGWLELRARGHDALRDEPPQGNQQLARDRDNPDAATPPARAPEPLLEPPRQVTGRLPAEPAPGHLQTDAPHLRPARLADALVGDPLVTAIRHRYQPNQRAQLPAIREGARPEQF